jgi:hypothetical protein
MNLLHISSPIIIYVEELAAHFLHQQSNFSLNFPRNRPRTVTTDYTDFTDFLKVALSVPIRVIRG